MEQGQSMRAVAESLGRNPASISREIRENRMDRPLILLIFLPC
ncbi:MAG: helix-turn-helix domain-containing protein [Spirochaetaceae bacterium]|nr:helix-turn-helix domain-containing protein [Spirochaetaceae bacterium]